MIKFKLTIGKTFCRVFSKSHNETNEGIKAARHDYG